MTSTRPRGARHDPPARPSPTSFAVHREKDLCPHPSTGRVREAAGRPAAHNQNGSRREEVGSKVAAVLPSCLLTRLPQPARIQARRARASGPKCLWAPGLRVSLYEMAVKSSMPRDGAEEWEVPGHAMAHTPHCTGSHIGGHIGGRLHIEGSSVEVVGQGRKEPPITFMAGTPPRSPGPDVNVWFVLGRSVRGGKEVRRGIAASDS